MNRYTFALFFLILPLLISPLVQAKGSVWILDIKGAIGPATADYFKRGLQTAQEDNANLIILRMDTPGGLDSAMREIVQTIIASPIPVISYVAPSGARAASAGTYILYASHVAAMAPATNLGAATPVQIGGLSSGGTNDDESRDSSPKDQKPSVEQSPATQDTMTNKIVNDAEAYLRALAQMHHRNVEWAAKAVRQSASLSAQEALEKGVIDLIAQNINELLNQINARPVKILGVEQRLVSLGLEQKIYEPDWRNRLLSILTNPNIAYILMLLGIYGLFFELSNPGSLLPGVIGGISLLLALFAFQVLPINYAGIALILLGIAFMISEAYTPSFGILGVGGLISFIIGSIILIDTETSEYTISLPLVGGLSVINVLFFVWVIKNFVKIRQRPVISGREEMLGEEGQCVTSEGDQLRIFVHSEIWNARALSPIATGQRVKVIGIDGLTLTVEAIKDS